MMYAVQFLRLTTVFVTAKPRSEIKVCMDYKKHKKDQVSTMKRLTQLLLAATALIAGTAHATLIGDTVNGNYVHLDPFTTNAPGGGTWFGNGFNSSFGSGDTATVGSGAEFTFDTGTFSIEADLGAESLTIDYAWDAIPGGGPLGGGLTAIVSTHFLTFDDLDWVGTPGSIIGVTAVGGISAPIANITHSANSIGIEIAEFTYSAAGGFHFEFDIEVEHDQPATVPEPGTLALFSLGIIGLTRITRNKRKSSNP